MKRTFEIILALFLVIFMFWQLIKCIDEEARIAERKAILKGDTMERKRIKKDLAEELYQESNKRAKEEMKKVPIR